jgi:hypothetical protein
LTSSFLPPPSLLSSQKPHRRRDPSQGLLIDEDGTAFPVSRASGGPRSEIKEEAKPGDIRCGGHPMPSARAPSVLDTRIRPLDVLAHALLRHRLHRRQAGLLLRAHGHQLRTTVHQLCDLLLCLVGQRVHPRAHVLGEPRQHMGVEAVGLGQDAGSTGEVTHALRMTTATATPATCNSPARAVSKPPVASTTTSLGRSCFNCSTRTASTTSQPSTKLCQTCYPCPRTCVTHVSGLYTLPGRGGSKQQVNRARSRCSPPT